jgi:hypothetical protein
MTAPGFRPSARLRKLSTISLGGTEESSNTWSTCVSVKRSLLFCQRGPSLVPKETYTRVKRDLHSCQTSPTLLVTLVFKDLVYVLEAGRCERFSAVLCPVQPHNRRYFEHFEGLYDLQAFDKHEVRCFRCALHLATPSSAPWPDGVQSLNFSLTCGRWAVFLLRRP